MAQQEPPRIEFPCDYSIRIVGKAAIDFQELVVDVVAVHAPDLDRSRVSIKDSSKGTFASVTLFIQATGPEQLEAIFTDLKATGRVSMVI
jgi:hypothetical protein